VKTSTTLLTLIFTGLSFSVLQGCYTQLAVYEDEPEYVSERTYVEDDTAVVESQDSDYYDENRSHLWLSFGTVYPSWYYTHYPPLYYDPYYYGGYWDYTVIYPYPWWWHRPWYAYSSWYWYSPRPIYYFHDYDYAYRPGGTNVRNSGIRRSGADRRRDYDPTRTAGATRPGVNTTAGRQPGGVNGRSGQSTATAGRSPAIEFNRPRPSAPTSAGRQSSTDRATGSSGRSWTVPNIIRGTSRGSSGSREATPRSSSGARQGTSRQSSGSRNERATSSSRSNDRSGSVSSPPQRSSPAPTFSRPSSSPAPSGRSSSGSSSGSRSSGSSRSNDSGRRR